MSDEQTNFQRCQSAIMAASRLTSSQKLVLFAISNAAKDSEFGSLGSDELQTATALSANVLAKVTSELAERGVLLVVMQEGQKPRYRIDVDALQRDG